ncbi:hypothetical protein [Pseudanabaena minima]|uniref:hypothetical protein n=1 Tax=Pseudanabaena minima TaxID=890415 RepID=UPI003DA966CE
MNRAEQLKAISFDTEEWEKSFYKYQQEYIRKRLKAIKYLRSSGEAGEMAK